MAQGRRASMPATFAGRVIISLALAVVVSFTMIPASSASAERVQQTPPSGDPSLSGVDLYTEGDIFILHPEIQNLSLESGVPTADVVLHNDHALWYVVTPRNPVPGSQLHRVLLPPCRAKLQFSTDVNKISTYDCSEAVATLGRMPLRVDGKQELAVDGIWSDPANALTLTSVYGLEAVWRAAFKADLPSDFASPLADLSDPAYASAEAVGKLAGMEFPILKVAAVGKALMENDMTGVIGGINDVLLDESFRAYVQAKLGLPVPPGLNVLDVGLSIEKLLEVPMIFGIESFTDVGRTKGTVILAPSLPRRFSSTPTPAATVSSGLIAYTGNDGNIWVTRADGSGPHQITTGGTPKKPFSNPRWSNDGHLLVFLEQAGENPATARTIPHILDLTTGQSRVINSETPISGPVAFHPDGKHLVAMSDSTTDNPLFGPCRDQAVLLDHTTGQVSPLAKVGCGIRGSLQFTPDGKSLIFVAGGTSPVQVINRIDLPSGAESVVPTPLVQRSPFVTTAAVSRDGERLAYFFADFMPRSSETRLFVAGKDGSVPRAIYQPTPPWTSFGKGDALSFSPDGSSLTFSLQTDEENSSAIWVVNSDGSNVRKVTDGSNPDWQPVPATLNIPQEAIRQVPAVVGKTVVYDDFSGSAPSQPPSGWSQFGTPRIMPTVEEAGGTGASRRVLSFPALPGGSADKWLVYDGATFSSPTATVKLSFQDVADAGGLLLAWKDQNSYITVLPNIYWGNVGFNEWVNGVWQTRIETARHSLRINQGTEYWLRVSLQTGADGSKTAAVLWSEDGTRFREILTVPNLASADGKVGLVTAGTNLPHVYFDDFRAEETPR